MNPQPDPIVGNFFAFIFVVLTMIYTYKAYIEGKTFNINNIDKFVIGYIEEYAIPEAAHQTKAKAVQNKKTHTNSPKKHNTPKTKKINQPTKIDTPIKEKVAETSIPPKPQRNEELYNDCISCLVSLGYKKTQAKQKVKKIFDEHNVTNIQQFIRLITVNTIDFS